MKQYGDNKYWEVGDSVIQSNYPGCPAIVIAVEEIRHQGTFYQIQIDATGHPEAFDENGEPQNIKFCRYSIEYLESLGN